MNNLFVKLLSLCLLFEIGNALSQQSNCFAQDEIKAREMTPVVKDLPGWIKDQITPEHELDSLLDWKLKVISKNLELREKSAIIYSVKDGCDAHVLASVWYIYNRNTSEAYLLKSRVSGMSGSSLKIVVNGRCNTTYKEHSKKIVGWCNGDIQFDDKNGISRRGTFTVNFVLTP